MKTLIQGRPLRAFKHAFRPARNGDRSPKPSVMLVVNEQGVGDLLEALFEEAGCVVARARSCSAALSMPSQPGGLVVLTRESLAELPAAWVRARRPVMLDLHARPDDVRAGIVDYLPRPSVDDVSDLLAREREARRSGTDAGHATVIATVAPARAGATFGAQLLLLGMTGPRVGLDCAQIPRLGTRLGLGATRSFLDLVPLADELTPTQLEQAIRKTRIPDLDVLMAPRVRPTPPVEGAVARSIVRALQTRYLAVVADVGSHPTDLGRAALEAADRVVLFVTPDGESLRDANDFIDATEAVGILNRSKVLAVLNRASSKAEMGARFARRVLRVDVSGVAVPSAWWALEEALNHSDPELIRSRRLRRPFDKLLVELGLE